LQVDLPLFPSFLIDKDRLLPSAWRLVSTMNAARPATWALLPLQQFLAGSLDAALARCWPFRVVDPADELIAPKRCQFFPQREDLRIRSNRCSQVLTCLVNSALGKSFHETSSGAA